ncbi:MAG TPA: hypothetical protein VHW70_11455 [Edaphobacter sp.]|jgi:uncharacterized protein YecT (DUF1311 family)|nr:hypothetical protein [Edaphobacter sp.]
MQPLINADGDSNGGTIRATADKEIPARMSFARALLRKFKISCVLGLLSFVLLFSSILPNVAGYLVAQESTSSSHPPEAQTPPPLQQPQTPPPPRGPVATYDKTIFQKPIPTDQLAFLNQFQGVPAKDVMRDKQFRKLMKSFVPDCMFHYGRDMVLSDALDMVFKDSTLQVQVRDGRYLTLSGLSGPYLAGRAFLWIDMQDGIGLGGFYFHPTNGEPTPSMNVFSRQVKEDALALSQLPPNFAEDLTRWSGQSRVPPVTTRYFLTGSNRKIVLEHDEEFCAPVDTTSAPADSSCVLMDADAADLDMDAANYLEQTHHATNATAWMINAPDQIAWLQVRDSSCGHGPNPVGCRIRMTHERTAAIIKRPPVMHAPHR